MLYSEQEDESEI